MSYYSTQRQLKSYWRQPGNPRLKGLLLAALPNTNYSAEDIGRAWVTDAEERKRHLQVVDRDRHLAAPVSQKYTPGAHDDLGDTHEESVARTLARKEFDDDDADRFLAGETAMDKDRYIQRALLNDSVTELDVLFREELDTTIIQGARPRKIFRDAAFVHNATKRRGDLPRVTDESYAPIISQGAEIETGQDGFDTVPYNTQKAASGFEITDEIIAESEPDVVEQLAREAGARVENTINRVALVELVDNADATFDADVGGTEDASAVQALNGATTQVDLNEFGPADTAVVHPEFEQAIFDDTNVVYANQSGQTEPLQDRQMGGIMGMSRWQASDGTYNGADDTKGLEPDGTWGYDGSDEIGGVAYEQNMFALVLWDDMDLVTKDWEDPIRDLQGSNVRSYVDAVWRQERGGATITHSTS